MGIFTAVACFCRHCGCLPVSLSIAAACLFLQALQLDFYGDAVVEAWRGTQHGEPHSRCQDAPDIFNAHFGREFESHAWGVAGDHVSCMHCSCMAFSEMDTAMEAECPDSKDRSLCSLLIHATLFQVLIHIVMPGCITACTFHDNTAYCHMTDHASQLFSSCWLFWQLYCSPAACCESFSCAVSPCKQCTALLKCMHQRPSCCCRRCCTAPHVEAEKW